jgi:hypothetical protein
MARYLAFEYRLSLSSESGETTRAFPLDVVSCERNRAAVESGVTNAASDDKMDTSSAMFVA